MRSELMMVGELARVGARNVRRNARRSLITGSMIALAVGNVIFFKGYALGIEKLLVEMAIEGKAGALQVQRRGYFESQELGSLDLDLPQGQGLETALAAQPGVRAVAPRLAFTGLLSNGDGSTMFLGLAVDPTLEPQVCPSGPGVAGRATAGGEGLNRLVAGAGLSAVDEEAVVLTEALAGELGVGVGDTVTLLARTQAGAMDSVDLAVKGIFHYDDPMGNRGFGVVPLAVAQRLLHMEGRVTAFAVALVDPAQVDRVTSQVRAALQAAAPPSATFAWYELAPYFRDVANLQDGMLGVIFSVVVLLVIAGIVNTMAMSTYERRREIGMLLSMGFRRWAIVVLFVVEATTLAAAAGVVGALGGLAAVHLAHATGLEFSVPGGSAVLTRPEARAAVVALSLVGAWLAALVAALFPAWRASRLQPIEALRAD